MHLPFGFKLGIHKAYREDNQKRGRASAGDDDPASSLSVGRQSALNENQETYGQEGARVRRPCASRDNASAEYFAEAFTFMISDPSVIPQSSKIVGIMNSFIVAEASNLP